MPPTEQAVRTYRELAEDYGHQGQAQMRDRFLVLAADAALAGGQKEEAERLRGRLLQHNPHHLLKPYRSFAEAMQSVDVQNYVNALRRSHPFEKAENLLEGLRQKSAHLPVEGVGAQLRPSASTKDKPPAGKEVAEGHDDLRVYRVLDADPPAVPLKPVSPSASAFSARPVPSPQSARSLPPLPAGAPEVLPLRRELFAESRTRADVLAEKEDHELGFSAWLSIGLFFLVLVLGIGLAAYVFARPFLLPA